MEPKSLSEKQLTLMLNRCGEPMRSEIRSHISAMDSEHRALLADNAALVDALRTLGRTAWAVGASASSLAVDALLAKPHPGAALFSEMEGLRKRVEGLEVAVTAYKSALNDTARERDEARALATTARAAALEEAATDLDRRAHYALTCERDREMFNALDGTAKALRALATTPPPPVVPMAKVREVLEAVGNERYEEHDDNGKAAIDDAMVRLGLIDGEP